MKIKQEPDFTDDKWWFGLLLSPIILGLLITLLVIMTGLTVADTYYWLRARLK